MGDLDLLGKLYDFYSENGYIAFQWKNRNYELLAEEGDILLIQQESIVQRFRNIQEALAFLAEQNVRLLND
jgi:hypothetical protein